MPRSGGISAAGASKSTDRRWEKPLTLSPLLPAPPGEGSWGEGSLRIFDPDGVDSLATPCPSVSPTDSDLVPLRGSWRTLTGPWLPFVPA